MDFIARGYIPCRLGRTDVNFLFTEFNLSSRGSAEQKAAEQGLIPFVVSGRACGQDELSFESEAFPTLYQLEDNGILGINADCTCRALLDMSQFERHAQSVKHPWIALLMDGGLALQRPDSFFGNCAERFFQSSIQNCRAIEPENGARRRGQILGYNDWLPGVGS